MAVKEDAAHVGDLAPFLFGGRVAETVIDVAIVVATQDTLHLLCDLHAIRVGGAAAIRADQVRLAGVEHGERAPQVVEKEVGGAGDPARVAIKVVHCPQALLLQVMFGAGDEAFDVTLVIDQRGADHVR